MFDHKLAQCQERDEGIVNMSPNKKILHEVSDYYSAKLAAHGDSPKGVDWNGEESQALRFEQLTKILHKRDGFSINDLGCGYGALVDYLSHRYGDFEYRGCDISGDMINAAQVRYQDMPTARFNVSSVPEAIADYGVASGIFNVRLNHSDAEWDGYLKQTLDTLDQSSRCGFSFNCLTSYSDADKMRDYLYYANPLELFDYCKRKFSRHVALLHDYGLYEFTILVRKQL